MKTLQEYLNEGIPGINQDLTPFEIAKSLKDYQYNTTDGGADCLGQTLQQGDPVLVFTENGLRIGVYTKKRGKFCQLWSANPNLGETEENSAQYLEQISCNKVFKLNKKDLNI